MTGVSSSQAGAASTSSQSLGQSSSAETSSHSTSVMQEAGASSDLSPARQQEIDSWVQSNANAQDSFAGISYDEAGGERVAEALNGDSSLGRLSPAEQRHLVDTAARDWARDGNEENIREALRNVESDQSRQVVADVYSSLGIEVEPSFLESLSAWHFEDRAAMNSNLPSYEEAIAEGSQWQLLPESQSIFHDNGEGKPELKFIHPDGREAVFDGDTHELVTDPEFAGTYNYVNPAPAPENWYDLAGWGSFAAKGLGHVVADVLPYNLGGNVRGEH